METEAEARHRQTDGRTDRMTGRQIDKEIDIIRICSARSIVFLWALSKGCGPVDYLSALLCILGCLIMVTLLLVLLKKTCFPSH